MQAQRKGAIVNISSIAAVTVNDYPYFSYYASKSGLNHLTRALAVRYAPFGIRANAIMPGLMDTPLIYQRDRRPIRGQGGDGQARNAMCPDGPHGRCLRCGARRAVSRLDDARYITGVCLAVDGGLSCKAEQDAPASRSTSPSASIPIRSRGHRARPRCGKPVGLARRC